MSDGDFLDILLARSAAPPAPGSAGNDPPWAPTVFDSGGLTLARPRTPSLFEPPGAFAPGPDSVVEMVTETTATPPAMVLPGVPTGLAAAPAPLATSTPSELQVAAKAATQPAPAPPPGWQPATAPLSIGGRPEVVAPPAQAHPFVPTARVVTDSLKADTATLRFVQHMDPSHNMQMPPRPDTPGPQEPVLAPRPASTGEASLPPPPLSASPPPGPVSFEQVERELASLRAGLHTMHSGRGDFPPPPALVRQPAEAPRPLAAPPPAPGALPTPEPPVPTIQVTIGRIEVRAAAVATAPVRHPAAPAPPLVTLDEYLRRRNGGKP